MTHGSSLPCLKHSYQVTAASAAISKTKNLSAKFAGRHKYCHTVIILRINVKTIFFYQQPGGLVCLRSHRAQQQIRAVLDFTVKSGAGRGQTFNRFCISGQNRMKQRAAPVRINNVDIGAAFYQTANCLFPNRSPYRGQ